MDIKPHKNSIMSFFIILFKCSEISSFEIQVCSHDSANAAAQGLKWTWATSGPSPILPSSQACPPSLAFSSPMICFSFYQQLPYLICFKTWYVIVFKYLPFVKFPSPPPVSYHHLSPVFRGETSRKISQHSMSLFPHLCPQPIVSDFYCHQASPLIWLMIYVLVKFNS